MAGQSETPTSVTAVGHGLPANYWSRAMAGVYGAWFIVLGNILEWYEFSLYGYLAPEMQKNFFDNSSIGAWAGFGVTFVSRPLGAFALGWVGDLFGRRIALLISLSGMMICTVGQGCVPSYYCCSESAGDIGLIVLLVLRFMQGICTGGEVANVATYLAEHTDKHVLGMMSASVGVSGGLGFLCSSTIVLIMHLSLDDNQMLLWGWRVPFLLSVIPGTLSLLGRRHLEESAEFVDMMNAEKQKNALIHNMDKPDSDIEMDTIAEKPHRMVDSQIEAVGEQSPTYIRHRHSMSQELDITVQGTARPTEFGSHEPNIRAGIGLPGNGHAPAAGPTAPRGKARTKLPLKLMLKSYPIHTITVFLGLATYSAVWYVSSVYSLDFLRTQQGVDNISADLALGMGVLGNVSGAIVAPLSGYLCDRVGVGKMFLAGQLALLVIIVPGWLWLILAPSVTAGFVTLSLWGLLGGVFLASPYLWTAEVFPTQIRSSGFMAYNLSVCIFGGCGPLISAALVENWSKFGPLVYQGSVTLVAGLVVLTAYIMHRKGKLNMVHIRPHPY